MRINDTDSFNEKCDRVLNYLSNISKSDNDVQILTHLNKLSTDTGISINDPVINFLSYQKNFITLHTKTAHVNISSLGMAFISHSSFVKEQLKSETEVTLKWYETENAKQIFDDYPIVKRRAIRGEAIAILALIVSGIAIVLPLICNKNG
jgi:hypothetical protein